MGASVLTNPNWAQYLPTVGRASGVELLTDAAREEVLTFLGARPVHNAYIAGLIRDNGLLNPLNRGTFYGHRNTFGQLEGIALIGRVTLVEAISDRALRALAETAQRCTRIHFIMCEEDQIDKFWRYYAPGGQEMRHACRQLLYELRWPIETTTSRPSIRLATLDELPVLLPVHAELTRVESGIDPREGDAAGFESRYARRIEQGRIWVLMDSSSLLFKGDVVAETPETTLVEGVWINPEARHQEFSQTCMSQFASMLLWRTRSICLFVNDENEDAKAFYQEAGYHLRSMYDTVFLKS